MIIYKSLLDIYAKENEKITDQRLHEMQRDKLATDLNVLQKTVYIQNQDLKGKDNDIFMKDIDLNNKNNELKVSQNDQKSTIQQVNEA